MAQIDRVLHAVLDCPICFAVPGVGKKLLKVRRVFYIVFNL